MGKLTRYLLVPLARGDKSAFLARAGYTADNPDCLRLPDKPKRA